jgi:hypothetical protein|tara:strand:- start:554 stop:748 length:195 start_codon:yes stop_codon:yes gene_type:complete
MGNVFVMDMGVPDVDGNVLGSFLPGWFFGVAAIERDVVGTFTMGVCTNPLNGSSDRGSTFVVVG